MAATADWIDLLDPDPPAVREAVPIELPDGVLARLTGPRLETPRPSIEADDEYVLAVLVAPVAVPAEDRVFYQEIDLVFGPDWIVSVRWTPAREAAFDPAPVAAACRTASRRKPGHVAHRFVDEIAEAYIDLVDAVEDEIAELEDNIELWPPARVRARLAALRQDLLRIRRTLAPTRDAVRKLVDLADDGPVVDRRLKSALGEAYEKLLRAHDGLDYARELLAGAREFHQAKIAEEQNEVVKKLTVIAALLLLPTFIVGVYGQNFVHMPELEWKLGYLWSWGLIVGSAVALLAFFRWRNWI